MPDQEWTAERALGRATRALSANLQKTEVPIRSIPYEELRLAMSLAIEEWLISMAKAQPIGVYATHPREHE